MGTVDKVSLYGGSRLLQPVVDATGFPLDQVNFISLHVVSLGLSYLYRKYLDHDHVPPTVRHVVNLVLGVLMTLFCVGREIWYLAAQGLACYVAMRVTPKHSVHKIMMVIAMGLLMMNHLTRVVADVGADFIDVSGSLMVCTQKLTSLGWSLHDGGRDADKLSPEHRRLAVRKQPSLLEFWSYVFYFQGVLVGPLCFYSDYTAFVEGNFRGQDTRPSPARTVMKKLMFALVAVALVVFMVPVFPPTHIFDAQFVATTSLLSRVAFMMVATFCSRQKYYFAWMMGESVCNMSGLGYNGVDSHGQHRWDLIDNVDIVGVESSTNVKGYIDAWNLTGGRWLRHVSYTRLPPRVATFLTFCLSAIWHGFYPGYYFLFICLAGVVATARQMRRRLRHHFLSSPALKAGYDVTTWVACHICTSYFGLPFIMLTYGNAVALYNSYYWAGHVIALTLLLLTTIWPAPRNNNSDSSAAGAAKRQVLSG